jgi:Tfp pilus assembly pilus retraction ATPase PilT
MMAWMEALVAAKGSDLHLKAGSPPRMRVDGRLVVLDGPTLTPDVADNLLRELIRPDLVELEDALSVATNPHDLQVALRSQGLVA